MASNDNKETFFEVLSSVGHHEAGEIIAVTKDDVQKGVDVERLVARGLIAEIEKVPKGVKAVGVFQYRNPDRLLASRGPAPVPATSEAAPVATEPEAAPDEAAQEAQGK